MKKITFMEALGHAAPQPVALICIPIPDSYGRTNLAPVAWWTFLESEPPMIGFSMAKQSYTCELASNTDKLVICLPGETIADEVLKCGTVTGLDVDKAHKYGIELAGGEAKYPAHSKIAFICTVSQRVPVGDCVFFVCSVDDILADEARRHIYTLGKSQKLGAL
ncbi:MAG: flavin reductase family protein [Defluviitaleaceae bacterium]|nr:flavin reductase family protein [Defluviitaleaceae bacterium]